MTRDKDYKKKMCVIGDAGVGKTSLIRRFVVDKFDDKYIATIGTKTSKKNVTVRYADGNVNLKLMIWDILGQKSFSELQKSAYKGASGAFIVLDLTRRETLHTFKNWLSSLYNVTGTIPVVVLANKNDLVGEFESDDIGNLVKDHGFPYYLTSAKTGENVNSAFHKLGKMILEFKPGEAGAEGYGAEVSEKDKEEVAEPGRKLTPVEVEDMIMAKYCDLLADQDYAMAVIREQFKKAGIDFKSPTVEGLTRAVDYLISAASDQVETNRLEREKRIFMNLIRRIG
jgi:small GTP-binding protein